MKVFITGATGLLGSSLIRKTPAGFSISASYHNNNLVPKKRCTYIHMELTSKTSVMKAIEKAKPDIVIHTAAIATPDYCDKNQDEAWNVNVKGTQHILDACKKVGAKIIFITTNGVYDGKNAPYSETDEPNPIDFYGKTKYEAEKLVKNSGVAYIIVRLITMYGWNNPQSRENPLTWQIRVLGRNKTPLTMVDDMFNNFLSVEEASMVIWKLVSKFDKHINQSFNVAGKECISRYAFSIKIAKIFDLDESMITPVKLSFFKNMVPRPENTCFTTRKMEEDLNIKPKSMIDGLKYLKKNGLSYYDWKEL